MATITSPRTQSPAGTPRRNSPSVTSTPTSSVRPSFDLPRNPTSSGGTSSPALQPQTTQRRNRAALRDYYNLKSKSPVPSAAKQSTDLSRTTSESTVTSNHAVVDEDPELPPQLDLPSFDPDSYVAEILQTNSLREMLRTESLLVSEIRNLDGERKALVYDNYSKLIKAVGTIAEMQKGMARQDPRSRQSGIGLDGVEKLQGRLARLTDVVGELERTQKRRSAGDDAGVATRRQKRSVRWVLGAPARLEGLIENGKRDEADREWDVVSKVLERWKDVAGAKEVGDACLKVMDLDSVAL